MTFNVSEFSSKINKYGLARDNLFFVTITPPPLGADMPAGDLSFFCRSVDLPALTINTTDIQTQGFGISEKRPTGLPLDNLNTAFMVDSTFRVKQFFHRWAQAVVNYDNSRGYNVEHRGMLPYEVNYKDEYTGRIEILVYSFNSDSITYKYTFDNAFPVSLGNITTAWANNDDVMVMPVQFAYDVYKVDGVGESYKATRTRQARGFGGGGPGGFITRLANFGQALDAIGVNTPIQDVVNQYSLFGSAVNSIQQGIRGIKSFL